MGRAYSQDLRERVLALVESGVGAYKAAPLMQVSVSYIYKARIRLRTTGENRALPHGGGTTPKLAVHDEALKAKIGAVPDMTLAELLAWLEQDRGLKASIGCLWNRLRKLGLTLKKSPSTPRNRSAPTSPRRASNGARRSPA